MYLSILTLVRRVFRRVLLNFIKFACSFMKHTLKSRNNATKVHSAGRFLNSIAELPVTYVREIDAWKVGKAEEFGDPYGNRTRVSAVKGPRPNR
jgi:hypothetical protein